MSDTVIAVVITGVVSIVCQLIISHNSSKELFAKLDKQSELADEKLKAELSRYQGVTDTKIDELTREVRKHNNFAERIPLIEAENNRQNERIKILENKTA